MRLTGTTLPLPSVQTGTVLDGIMYQPYIGNGYVEGMEELTPEQNAALRELV